MANYIFLHGLNGGPDMGPHKLLENVLGEPVYCPLIDYSLPYDKCMENINEVIFQHAFSDRGQICLMGISIGGFYATQLRLPNLAHVIAWNPVIMPALQLWKFIGENTRTSDNKKWNFTQETCLSYAQAPDPRQWNNFYLEYLKAARPEKWEWTETQPERDIIIGIKDELLNPDMSLMYWKDHASELKIDSGHHVTNFDHVMTILG